MYFAKGFVCKATSNRLLKTMGDFHWPQPLTQSKRVEFRDTVRIAEVGSRMTPTLVQYQNLIMDRRAISAQTTGPFKCRDNSIMSASIRVMRQPNPLEVPSATVISHLPKLSPVGIRSTDQGIGFIKIWTPRQPQRSRQSLQW